MLRDGGNIRARSPSTIAAECCSTRQNTLTALIEPDVEMSFEFFYFFKAFFSLVEE